MKQIYLNLKRFDIPPELGGVNRLAPISEWGGHVVLSTQAALLAMPQARYTLYFPEAHILGAVAARTEASPIVVGCQGVHWADTQPGGNFGAFTTLRTAHAMRAAGCGSAIIGHCEERRFYVEVLREAQAEDAQAISRLLNREAKCAQAAGLHVLFCIGETAEQREEWQAVLASQLSAGLDGLNRESLTIAYEPVWAIGPGKIPPGREQIQEIAAFIKDQTNGLPLVYGGGLKVDNAAMLASIPEMDGGLIALTRFQGEIGFYPEEYLEIIRVYLEALCE